MGFMSNQFLTGLAERNRKHTPSSVVVSADVPHDDWSVRHGIKMEIRADRPRDFDYQELSLTQEEVDLLARSLAANATPASQRTIILSAFHSLEAADLLDIMTDLLSRRRQAAKPLSELELSIRATNCLESEGINTVADLCSRTADQLLEVRNFGETTLREVQQKLASHGFHLRGES
jgi:DNA-directed RNA polymerase alpha subunit